MLRALAIRQIFNNNYLQKSQIIGVTKLLTQFDNRYQNISTTSSVNEKTQQPGEVSNTDKFLRFSETEGYIKTSNYGHTKVPNQTLDQYVWRDVHKWLDKIATVCIVTGRQYTFGQLRDSSAALAVRLQNRFGLKPRDVIAVCLPNLPEYPIAVFGGLEAGLAITTINPIYTADEISRQLIASKAKLIICTYEGSDNIQLALKNIKQELPVLCIRTTKNESSSSTKCIDFLEMIDLNGIQFSDLKPTNITGDDIAFLPFSSGTTGLPKGVMLTHNNITSNCEQVQTKVPNDYYMRETTKTYQESLPCFLPFFHIYGLTVCLISKIGLGCKQVTIPRFTPDDLLKALTVHKGTVLNLVPPILLFMAHSPQFKNEDIPYLHGVMSGAAPVGALDVERFMAKFPSVKFNQGYGLTETSPVICMTPIGNTKYASCGHVVASAEAKIVHIDENETSHHKGLGPNQTGELCVRGNNIMLGYLNDPEATEKTFYPDKWLRTGDVAYYDDEGYIFITDRMKELIKVKGFQVPPAELEELLRHHPKIIDAAVFGIAHAKSGEVPKAVVVLRPGEKATEQEIKQFVAERVAEYKRLDGGIVFVNEIPKNASGKLLRKDLKKQFDK